MRIGVGLSIPELATRGGRFSPASLFTSGVAGAWYDPSDINNYMAGRGSELVAPINFNTGWTASGAAITVNSAASFTSAGVSNYYIAPFTVGRWYAVTINATFTGSTLDLYNGASAVNQITPTGLTSGVTQTFYFLALATQFNIRQSSAGTVTVNSIAVAELTGIANATLFQDSAGTTPVTAVEQPVGLMLDKSQGLVLGSEVVISPYTGTVGGSWLVGSTSVTRNGSAISQASITLNLTPSTSKTYLVQFTVADLSGDTFGYRIGGGTAYQVTANGTYTSRITGGGASAAMVFIPWGGSAGQATITNISVKELPGNHASQATAASRPVLRARYNQATYSEQVDNAAWSKSQIVTTGSWVNQLTAPDGTLTADLIRPTNVSSVHYALLNSSLPSAAGTYTCSLYVYASGYSKFSLRESGSTGAYVSFDIATVSVIDSGNVGTVTISSSSITAVPGYSGWYRAVVTYVYSTGVTPNFGYWALSPSYTTGQPASLNWAGDGTSGIYIWGAQIVTGSSAGTYQRIAAATDYATAGFLPYLYFVTDDSFGTNSIDFTATDKMSVCAGITKSSDASVSIPFELSANHVANAGSFALYASASALPNYEFRMTSTANAYRTATTYTAPITNVLSCAYDIAQSTVATEIVPKVNGATPTLVDSGSAGTGNFGNYPLFIGRRNNATFPFNGNLYQLIVCGKTLSASELASTEAYVNSKTGAY